MKLFKSLLIALATAIPHHTECVAETSLGKVILKMLTTIIVFDTQSTPIPTTIGMQKDMQKRVWTTYAPGTLDAPSKFVTDNDTIKKSYSELIDYLQHPEQYADKKVSRGILIEGPYNERVNQFVRNLVHKSSCALIAVRGKQLSEGNLVALLFEEARQMAPSIIFVDDLDAMPHTPLSNRKQLALEIFNLAEHKQPFIVIATINNAGSIDEAFKGHGHFDQVLSL